MIHIVENATHLHLSGDRDDLVFLRHALRYRPNGYFYSLKFERYRITNGEDGWDGYNYPLRMTGFESAVCLRGFLDRVLDKCEKDGIRVDKSQLLPRPFSGITVGDIPPDILESEFQLDDHQRESVAQWLRHGIGVVNVSVSGGKTATFAAAAAIIKQRYPESCILYITPTERLVRQSAKALRGFLPSWEISQYGGGKNQSDGKDMVVATIAMINRHFHDLTEQKWFNRFIGIFYDEVHHAGSKASQRLILESYAYFRFGASDSIKEQDPTRFHSILGLFGPVRSRTAAHDLIEVDRIAQPSIYLVDIDSWHNRFKKVPYRPQPNTPAFVLDRDNQWVKATYLGPSYDRDPEGNIRHKAVKVLDDYGEWVVEKQPITLPGVHHVQIGQEELDVDSTWVLLERVYDRAVIRFKERSEMIGKWAAHFSAAGHQTLVVCTRTLHVVALDGLLRKMVPDGEKLVKYLVGQAGSNERDAVFDWFRQTPGSVLITPLAQEGVSIHEIRAVIVADYVSDWERANQIIGRALRKKEGLNVAEVVWFVDRQHPTLRAGCLGMIAKLRRIRGYQFYYPVGGPDSLSRVRKHYLLNERATI